MATSPNASAPLRVTVVDYGAGNLHSLIKALESHAAQVRVGPDPETAVHDTDALILPGVGAFAPAAARLVPGRDVMREAILGGLPTLGICLGMQLLFDGSEEGPGRGLSIMPGQVRRLSATRLPQIGWNSLEEITEPLVRTAALDVAYYANSFVARPAADGLRYVTAWSTHESDRFPATVRRGHVVGTQFHPEKSSAHGLAFLRAFLSLASSLRSMA